MATACDRSEQITEKMNTLDYQNRIVHCCISKDSDERKRSKPWIGWHCRKGRLHSGGFLISPFSFAPGLCPQGDATHIRSRPPSSVNPLLKNPHKHNRRYSPLRFWEFQLELTVTTSSPFGNLKLKYITVTHNISHVSPKTYVQFIMVIVFNQLQKSPLP